jgi:hypothetical protein
MPFSLGFWAAAGAGGAVSDFELIETVNLTGSAASVTFSNVPSNYRHLQIRVTARTDNTTSRAFWLRFNADSGTNYAYHSLVGTGSTVTADTGSSTNRMFFSEIQNSSVSSAYSALILDVLDYANTSKNKTVRKLWGLPGSLNRIALTGGLWTSTSAITSITLLTNADNFATGSRFSLYGIKG